MCLRLITYREIKHMTAIAQKRRGRNRKISTLYVKWYNIYEDTIYVNDNNGDKIER